MATLPQGLAVLFISAASAIGQSALRHFAQRPPSPRIYTVVRPVLTASHESLQASLWRSHPDSTYNLITADGSLVSGIGKVIDNIMQAGDKAWNSLHVGQLHSVWRPQNTKGLKLFMTTHHYSRVRRPPTAAPLNNLEAKSPHVFSVLAGGLEGPLKEGNFDLRNVDKLVCLGLVGALRHHGYAGVRAARARESAPEHCALVPGPVGIPGLARGAKFGMSLPLNAMNQDEPGVRALFLVTIDLYAVNGGGSPCGA
ncbi:hypothetical protein DL769_004872 [Monosporascus sp. CRB-8-3]|nr:hypothetical protein DL769_004872 [Monosporascus sp. CRB-8-3]